MYLSETHEKKWQPVLEHPDLPEIKDSYRRAVTSVILENQERAAKEDQAFLSEAAPTNATGSSIANWDPILISLVRRSMPNLIAYDIAGVQPMTGPTGLIFAMRSRYTNQTGTEPLFNEADASFSGNTFAANATQSNTQIGTDPNDRGTIVQEGRQYNVHSGMSTQEAERLGGTGHPQFAE